MSGELLRGRLIVKYKMRDQESWCYPGEDNSLKNLNLPLQAKKSHWSILYSEGYSLTVGFGKNGLAELRQYWKAGKPRLLVYKWTGRVRCEE